MDLAYANGSELPTDNATALLYNSYMPLWEDFNSSVNDLRYFLIGLYTTVSVLGLLGNILILTALARKWKEKTIINFLVGNLAFSDILVVLFCSPFTLTCVLLDHWIFGEAMCHIVPFLQCVSVVVSTLVLMSIAMVRYHMISRPLSNHLSVNSGYLLLIAIWMLGLSICSPLPIFHTTVDLSETFHLESLQNKSLCIESWPSAGYRIAFTICLLFIQYILPVACLTVSHATVCRRVSSGVPIQPPPQVEENEMIRLTLQQPDRRVFLPRRFSNSERWRLALARKQRRRYSKKACTVGPATSSQDSQGSAKRLQGGDHQRPSALLLRSVPVCFELKDDETTAAELRKMLATSKSVSRMRKRSRSVFIKLTVVVLAFAVSWMPLHVFHLLTDFSANLISSRHFKLIYCICHLLGMMSCCLNPILYGFLNNGIKSDLLSLIKCFYIM
ncbi:neuropeptide Y receptor type 5-like [Megalops cyprinoides]|uniref:neuropeptide Y receptor type 5-like n=1 Tax=Megalops cyprinoides TaxID=118141 RepID=UPI0018654EE5|nr:neuropeptide Y receptor type 5-like [Megalops cyprinoides]